MQSLPTAPGCLLLSKRGREPRKPSRGRAVSFAKRGVALVGVEAGMVEDYGAVPSFSCFSGFLLIAMVTTLL